MSRPPNAINAAHVTYRDNPSETNLTKLLELCRKRIVQRFAKEPDNEDIAQNAILRLWRKLCTYDDERGSFAPFVAVTARTTMLNMRRKQTPLAVSDHDLMTLAERHRSEYCDD